MKIDSSATQQILSLENMKNGAFGVAGFFVGTRTASLAYENVLYSAYIIKLCALQALNASLPQNQNDLALGALKITDSCLGHIGISSFQFGLVAAGICLTGYCASKLINRKVPENKVASKTATSS
jgi:hypothetical protein